MANARVISFLWLVAQGIAVVISILLAFGIQAWWDERREREEERQILEVLATDLRKGIEVIEFGLRYHTAKQDSALRLIEASEGLRQPDAAESDVDRERTAIAAGTNDQPDSCRRAKRTAVRHTSAR